ncbi:tape measure protein [Pseudarthrobacter enclensis]|uniref:tape measure protein n=1 Tax=Pseudarthrobacter enclensis TaxID=993070 RepID=UPI0036803417
MATELGAARISVGLDTSKIAGEIRKAFSGVDAEGSKAGKSAGGGFASGFKGLVGPAIAAVSAIGFGGLIAEAARASDATDKFKATMNFAGLDTSAIDQATAAAKEFADQTVYDLPTIQNTIAQLASNGIKDYTGLTKAAGNLNAVAGGNADTFKSVSMVMTQTAGAGKLTTENWNQMADAIPGAAGPLMKALEEAGAYTGNFRDAMAAGEITADEFNAALQKLGNDPVAVEAAKSTATFEGALGNLEATINSGLMSALDALKPTITGVIGLMSNGLGKAFEFVGTGASKLGTEITGGFRAFGAAFKAADGDVTSSGFAGVMEQAANAIRPIFDAARPLVPVIGALVSSFSPLSLLFHALMPVLPAVLNTFTQLGVGIAGTLTVALAQLVPMVQVFVGHLSGVVTAILPAVTAMILTLGSAFTQLVPVVMSVLSAIIPLATTLLSQLSPIITNLVTAIMPPLVSIFGNIVSAIGPLIGVLMEALIPAIEALMPVVVTVFSFVAELIKNVMQAVQGVIQVVTGLIKGDWEQVWTGIGNIFGAVWANIQTIVSGAIAIVGALITMGMQNASRIVGGVLENIGNFFINAFRDAGANTANFIGTLVGFFTSLPGKIMGALAGAGSWLVDVGRNIVQGLIDGVSGMINNAVRAVTDVGGAMLDGVKGFLGIHSPSRVFRDEVGLMIGAGVVQGVNASRGGVTSAVESLVAVPHAPTFSAGSYTPVGSVAGAGAGVSASFNITQVDDPIGTAHAVTRRLSSLTI